MWRSWRRIQRLQSQIQTNNHNLCIFCHCKLVWFVRNLNLYRTERIYVYVDKEFLVFQWNVKSFWQFSLVENPKVNWDSAIGNISVSSVKEYNNLWSLDCLSSETNHNHNNETVCEQKKKIKEKKKILLTPFDFDSKTPKVVAVCIVVLLLSIRSLLAIMQFWYGMEVLHAILYYGDAML